MSILLQLLAQCPHCFHTVLAHTRWASIGAITLANCHPVDNLTKYHGKAQSEHHSRLLEWRYRQLPTTERRI